MAYLNKIDINGRTYYLQHLTDGKNEARLPTPVKDDELLLRSQVINSVTSKESQSGYRVPLSASQGYSLNAKLNKEIVDREADVDEEQTRAEAAELVLTNNLNQEIQDRTNDVNEEQQRAEAAEKVLTDNLNKEIQDRTDDVNAEKTRALAAEKVLTDNLAQEIINRTNAVTAEQNRAIAKENEISANLTTEINRAKATEQTNATAIATEQSRAEGVEANHESRIATIETFFNEADIDATQEFIDTLKEIQTYIEDDKTGAAAMSASIQTNKTAIETEAGRAKGIEADLQSQITAEVTTARAAEKANADAIAVLNSDNTTVGSVAKAVNDAKTALESEIAKKLDAGDAYVHPIHDSCVSGLYKITVDKLGHVSSVAAATKNDIVNLGIPGEDTTYEIAVATTETEDGVDGLLSAIDKAKYDKYEATIASLQQQIADLKALVESYHPVVEQEPEPEPETE